MFFADPGAISTSSVLAYRGTLRALAADLAWFRRKPLSLRSRHVEATLPRYEKHLSAHQSFQRASFQRASCRPLARRTARLTADRNTLVEANTSTRCRARVTAV